MWNQAICAVCQYVKYVHIKRVENTIPNFFHLTTFAQSDRRIFHFQAHFVPMCLLQMSELNSLYSYIHIHRSKCFINMMNGCIDLSKGKCFMNFGCWDTLRTGIVCYKVNFTPLSQSAAAIVWRYFMGTYILCIIIVASRNGQRSMLTSHATSRRHVEQHLGVLFIFFILA